MTTATLLPGTGLGSTMAVVDASGAVQDSYTYDVYGTPSKTGSLANEFDFAGQQTDGTGLQYLRTRYMDPATGTFLSRDPLALRPSWLGNEQTYVAANPVGLTDKGGLKPTDVCEPDCGWTQGGDYQSPQLGRTPTAGPARSPVVPPRQAIRVDALTRLVDWVGNPSRLRLEPSSSSMVSHCSSFHRRRLQP